MSDLRNHIAQTIRRADGNHTMGAGALADAIVDGLADAPNQTLLAFALRATLTETELVALKLLIEGGEFNLRDAHGVRLLHAAVTDAIDAR